MKSIYLFEAENVNKSRETIVKERLVYLKYLMDNTSNKKEVTKLEKMYNCLYNLNYNVNGRLRSLNDMFTYINQTMTENKGLIPDLPTNDQIISIDEKAKAFKELHKSDFDAYLTRFDKTNIDKAETKKTDDSAKSVLSPENPQDNKKALEEIRKISSVFGLTNIIGLEPTRQASKEDVKRQEELKKQQQDGDPKATQHDKEATQEEPTDKPKDEPKNDENGNAENAESDETNDNKTLSKEEALKQATPEQKEEIEDIDDDEWDEILNTPISDVKESLNEADQNQTWTKRDTRETAELIAGIVRVNQVRKETMMLNRKIEQEKDPEIKKKLERQRRLYAASNMDDRGNVIADPIIVDIRKKWMKKHMGYTDEDDLSEKELTQFRQEAKQLKKENPKEYKQIKKGSWKNMVATAKDANNEMQQERKRIKTAKKEEKKELKRQKKEAKLKDKGKLQTFKDKDGSRLVARKKRFGSGMTYTREKDGKTIAYMSKDEFQAAQKTATKESYQMKSLRDHLLESLQ